MTTPFNKPFVTGNELNYIQEAIDNDHLSGNGSFMKRCQTWLEETIGCQKALLTHSCTAALEMSAILANLQPEEKESILEQRLAIWQTYHQAFQELQSQEKILLRIIPSHWQILILLAIIF